MAVQQPISLEAAPLRKQVIKLIRDGILTFEFTPGDRLIERDLCERFGVSRTVVREAMRQLEAEGLVDLVGNRGPVVSVTSAEAARHLFEVRETLEAAAARFCAERATPAQKARLARALGGLEKAYLKDDLLAELAAKDSFYNELCLGADNPVITSMLRGIQARAQMLRGLSLQRAGRKAESLSELRSVVTAIEQGDADLAATLCAQHVRNAAAAAFDQLSELEQKTPAASEPGAFRLP